MAHQPALRPDPLPRPQPAQGPFALFKRFGKASDSDHLAELPATLAANGGGESSPDLALDLVLNEIIEQARVRPRQAGRQSRLKETEKWCGVPAPARARPSSVLPSIPKA